MTVLSRSLREIYIYTYILPSKRSNIYVGEATIASVFLRCGVPLFLKLIPLSVIEFCNYAQGGGENEAIIDKCAALALITQFCCIGI